MDDLLRWLPVILVLAGVLVMWGRTEQAQKFMRDEVDKITKFIDGHRDEHRGIDKTLVQCESDIEHVGSEMHGQHMRTTKRIDDLRDEMHAFHRKGGV